MLDQIGIKAQDVAKAKGFYDAALAPLVGKPVLRADATTARRARARSITRITSARSCLISTATISRPRVTRRSELV